MKFSRAHWSRTSVNKVINDKNDVSSNAMLMNLSVLCESLIDLGLFSKIRTSLFNKSSEQISTKESIRKTYKGQKIKIDFVRIVVTEYVISVLMGVVGVLSKGTERKESEIPGRIKLQETAQNNSALKTISAHSQDDLAAQNVEGQKNILRESHLLRIVFLVNCAIALRSAPSLLKNTVSSACPYKSLYLFVTQVCNLPH